MKVYRTAKAKIKESSYADEVAVKSPEVRLKGTPICRGIAIGKAIFIDERIVEENIEYSIAESEVEKEVERYREALTLSVLDIKRLQQQLEIENASEGIAILESHLLMLQDPLITTDVENKLRENRKNSEHIFQILIEQYQQKFSALPNSYFRERFKDIQDISRRILHYLRKDYRISLTQLPSNSVVFIRELSTSDIAEAKSNEVSAFVTEKGGVTSHAAIVAKAKGIPFVAGIKCLAELFSDGAPLVIVDGRNGDIIINPSESTLSHYVEAQKIWLHHYQVLEKEGTLAAKTIDNHKVRITANIEMTNEIELLHQYGGEGVGLFRSENIFFSKNRFPTEEEQFVIYREIIEKMNGLPVVIRTFDIGGDKLPQGKKYQQEQNPYLGCRAIRLLLKERAIFNAQFRAILRASAYGNVSILFPMISGLPELLEAKQMIRILHSQLSQNGVPVAKRIPIGCMVEIPAAALIVDLLAAECDFLSIGTNDLVQYCLAVDRGSQAMSFLYTPMHPSVLRLIKHIITEARQKRISVTICGEVAADPRFIPLLIGMEANELSVAARHIPIVKSVIRRLSLAKAKHLVTIALNMSTAEEIENFLTTEYKKNFPDELLLYY